VRYRAERKKLLLASLAVLRAATTPHGAGW
jgi:hypothetical protein